MAGSNDYLGLSAFSKLLKQIRENRFNSGMACVHCGSTSVKRNGKYKTRQRYLCKDCIKTFNDMNNTPFSGSRYPEKWVKYMEIMVEGYTLPIIAKRLKIHFTTGTVRVKAEEIDAAIEKLGD